MAAPDIGSIHDGYRFKGGDPSNQDAWEQVSPIDVSSQYGAGARQLPNGTIERVGPRGGVTKIQSAEGAGSGPALVGADARSRYQIGIDPITDSLRATAAEEARGGNPINRDWGAVLLDGVNIPLPGDNDIRPLGWLAKIVGGQDYQNYTQALATYESSLMPIMSGAAVTASEARRMIRADFPQLGDSEETIKRKARNRMSRLNAVYVGLGRDPIFSEEQLANPATAFDKEEEAVNELAGVAGGSGSGPISGGLPPGITEEMLRSSGFEYDPETGKWVQVTSSDLSPDDTPESLRAQGYELNPNTGRWTRTTSTREAPQAQPRSDWTPEGAVEQRNRMWGPLRQIDAFGRGAADALSLEFADEAAAGADALFGQGIGDTIGDRYRNNVEVQRAIDQSDREEAGLARNIGHVAGFGAAALTQAPRILSQVGTRFTSPLLRRAATGARNALSGAAIAGTAAAGEEEGNALERIQAGLRAAPAGGFVGAVAPPVVNETVNRIGAPVARALGRQVGRVGQAAGIRGSSALVERFTPNALEQAVERFGSRMGGERVSQAADRIGNARGLGVDANLVTGLDDASIGRVRALATRDTPSRDLAVESAELARDRLPSRVRSIATDEISQDQRPTLEALEGLTQQRRNNASAIQSFGDDMVNLGEDAVMALRADMSNSAIRAAARRAQSSTNPEVRNSANRLNSLADTVLDNPSSVQLTVREAQDISKALNEAADAAYRGSTPADGPVLKELANAIRGSARESSEGYSAWLRQYGDDSDLINAATTGRNFVSVSADPVNARSSDAFIRNALEGTDDARAIQRQAAGQAMQAAASNPTSARGVLDRAARDEDFYGRAEALGVDAGRVSNRARAELDNLARQQRASPRVGSETSANLQDAGGAMGITPEGAMQAVRSPISSSLGFVARRFAARGFSDAEAEALVAAAVDPRRTDELISMLSQRMSRKEARTLSRAVHRQLSAGTGSSSVE